MKIVGLMIPYNKDITEYALAIVIAHNEERAKKLLARKRSNDWSHSKVVWSYELIETEETEREKILEHLNCC